MNREIKFRGKRKNKYNLPDGVDLSEFPHDYGKEKWVYGDLVWGQVDHYFIVNLYSEFPDCPARNTTFEEVYKETLDQYTNKLCQDEYELYEDDLVSVDFFKISLGQIVFEKLKFSLKWWVPESKRPAVYGRKEIVTGSFQYMDLSDCRSEYIKRLGNTTDNLELLEAR